MPRHSQDRRQEIRHTNEPQSGDNSAGRVSNFKRRAKCQAFCATRLAVGCMTQNGRNTAHWLPTAHPDDTPVLYPPTEDGRKMTLKDCEGRPVYDLQDVRIECITPLFLKLSALIESVVNFTFRSLYPRYPLMWTL